MIKHILVFLLLGSLSACSSNSTPPKPPYNLKYQFYSDKNYQYIYRTILNNADACTKQGVVSKSISEGQLFTEIKAADVTVSLHAPFGKYPHIRVKIENEGEKTKVVVTNDFETWNELAIVIQDWITNDTTFCR